MENEFGTLVTDLNSHPIGLLRPSEREELWARLKLIAQINSLLDYKQLSEQQMRDLLDMDDFTLTALRSGYLAMFSFERLFELITLLGHDVEIGITPHQKLQHRSSPRIMVYRNG